MSRRRKAFWGIALLATFAMAFVSVPRRPKIGIFSTGPCPGCVELHRNLARASSIEPVGKKPAATSAGIQSTSRQSVQDGGS